MPVDWQTSWNQANNGDRTGGDVQQGLQYADPVGDVWGAFSGGDKDPIHKEMDKQFKSNNNINWQPGDEAVYRQMDASQWAQLQGKQQQYQRAWIETRKRWLAQGHDDQGNPVKPGIFTDPVTGEVGQSPADKAAADAQAQAQAQRDAEEAQYQQWRKETMTKLSAFADEMNMPVEQLIAKGDLGVMNAGATGRSQAGAAAYSAGLGGGGISNLNTQRAVTDAQSKYQLQRAGLGLQASNQLMQGLGSMSHDMTAQDQYNQGLNLQLQQAQQQANMFKFQQGQSNQANMWGMAGGVLGGIYGGPAGAAAGQKLGSGLGASSYGQYNPTPYSYPSTTKTNGSGGLGGYGGAQ